MYPPPYFIHAYKSRWTKIEERRVESDREGSTLLFFCLDLSLTDCSALRLLWPMALLLDIIGYHKAFSKKKETLSFFPSLETLTNSFCRFVRLHVFRTPHNLIRSSSRMSPNTYSSWSNCIECDICTSITGIIMLSSQNLLNGLATPYDSLCECWFFNRMHKVLRLYV